MFLTLFSCTRLHLNCKRGSFDEKIGKIESARIRTHTAWSNAGANVQNHHPFAEQPYIPMFWVNKWNCNDFTDLTLVQNKSSSVLSQRKTFWSMSQCCLCLLVFSCKTISTIICHPNGGQQMHWFCQCWFCSCIFRTPAHRRSTSGNQLWFSLSPDDQPWCAANAASKAGRSTFEKSPTTCHQTMQATRSAKGTGREMTCLTKL